MSAGKGRHSGRPVDKSRNRRGAGDGHAANGAQKLDLGLSSILGDTTRAAAAQSSSPESPEVFASASNAAETESQLTYNEYEKLAAAESWRELASLCESRCPPGRADENIEARLWWIRSQLELRAVPLSILAAPLESCTRKLIEDSATTEEAVRELAHSTLLDLGEGLLRNSEWDLGASFVERATKLGSSGLKLMRERVSAHVRNPKLPEQHKGRLQALCGEAQEGPAAAATSAKMDTVPEAERLARFQAKMEERKGSAVNSSVLVTSPPVQSTFLRWPAAAGIFLVILAALFLYRPDTLPNLLAMLDTSASPVAVNLNLGSVARSPQLIAPSSERVQTLSELDAIYYEFNQRGSAGKRDAEAVQPTAAETVTEVAAASLVSSPVATPIEVAKLEGPASPPAPELRPTKPAKEKVDTSGPLESERDRRERSEPEATTSGLRDDLFGKGSLRDAFRDGRIQRVIVRTKVMAEPSYRANVVDVLDIGARVEVVSKDGPWLKLRSRMGKPGYILAQDTEDVGG